MTEQEWLASTDPSAMLQWALNGPHTDYVDISWGRARRVTDMTLRLFAVACCRSIWNSLTDPHSRKAVEGAERLADGEVDYDESIRQSGVLRDTYQAWSKGRHAEFMAWVCVASHIDDQFGVLWFESCRSVGLYEPLQANLLRSIVGNPWRPVTVYPAWLTETVKRLAEAAYRERTDTGTLDPARLLVLSDALEEAGCPQTVECEKCVGWGNTRHRSADASWMPSFDYQLDCEVCNSTGRIHHPLLAALRSEGAKYRGFWALDLLMRKE